MKIFQVAEYISSAFDIILNNNQKKTIFNTLELLYINNYINDEILLNLIKAFVIIFYNNSNYSILYSKILDNLSEEETEKFFNLFKKIKFSNQMEMEETIINKIILTINNYIINHNDLNHKNNYNVLLNIFNIYDIIKLNKKISLENKIKLFLILLKDNANISDVRQSISLINKF